MNYHVNLVFDLVRQAGERILEHYHKVNIPTYYKDGGSPLTDADIESNEIIVEGLKKTGIRVLSEEMVDNKTRLREDMIWIVDPLDGTKDFIERTGDFTVMVALVENKRSVFGVVYKPVNRIMYYAKRGKGAYIQEGDRKPRRIYVSGRSRNLQCKMLSSRFHQSELEVAFRKNARIKEYFPFGSSMKICKIAEGLADINFNPAPKTYEWDICAADVILHEAGGTLTDTRGRIMRYNRRNPLNKYGYLATNTVYHPRSVKRIKRLRNAAK